MRFKRSSGITPSEKILADLCDTSFLTLWSYPNLFKKRGKELCDLLVIFGDDVIIFSDKSCAFPRTGNLTLDWVRWYRKSITDSVHQLSQAERWLRSYPDKVFLDAGCTAPLPIELPRAPSMQVHHVCIALGATERAEEETGKKALKIFTCKREERFAIGKIIEAKGWVHVFDENNFPVLLKELSTAADFLEYLKKKEGLFDSGNFIYAESELDLMAYFLWHGREFPIPAAIFKLDPDLWEKVEADPQFLAGRKENEISVFWDRLIEYLTHHYMQETLERGNELSVPDYERGVRVMASETRFHRRVLTKCILERADRAKGGYIGSILPSARLNTHYVLLIGPGDGGKDHAAYRKARNEQLYARCIASKAARPATNFIIGLGMDARGVKGTSEDFIFMDTSDWSEQRLAAAEKLRQELSLFVDGKTAETKLSESEYPTANGPRAE
jgi:hypothetical protein